MCGISGIVGKGMEAGTAVFHDRSQRHRGPDMVGRYFDPNGLGALALNRLSILDLSDAGRQPMTDPESGLTIALNGEIYNFLELRQELRDYPYHSQTDTEVVLAAYQKMGRGVPRSFHRHVRLSHLGRTQTPPLCRARSLRRKAAALLSSRRPARFCLPARSKLSFAGWCAAQSKTIHLGHLSCRWPARSLRRNILVKTFTRFNRATLLPGKPENSPPNAGTTLPNASVPDTTRVPSSKSKKNISHC